MIKSSIQKVCRWLRSPSKMAIGGVILLTIIGTIVGTNLFNAGMAKPIQSNSVQTVILMTLYLSTKRQSTLVTVQV